MNFPNSIIKIKNGYCLISLEFKITSKGFLEGDWLNSFKNILEREHTEWHNREGNCIYNFEKLGLIDDIEDVPKFYCDLEIQDSELSYLCLRVFTNSNLLGFMSGLDDLHNNIQLESLIKNNGVEFNP